MKDHQVNLFISQIWGSTDPPPPSYIFAFKKPLSTTHIGLKSLYKILIETCKTFDASIRLFDKDEAYLASVNFTVDTVFDVYSLDNDFHTISIKSFDPPEDSENHAYLEVNVEQECPL